MAKQLALGHISAIELEQKLLELAMVSEPNVPQKPTIVQSHSDPTPIKSKWTISTATDDRSACGPHDIVRKLTISTPPRRLHSQLPARRQSSSTEEESLAPSRSSSPRPSLPSSTTTPSLYTVDSFIAVTAQRPSVFSRLRSSISGKSTCTRTSGRPIVVPADFQIRPEEPEKRFVDSIGMLLPGVSDRSQCTHPIAHFVSMFRLCEPIEYTTALADHGITYTDYGLLVTALLNFLEDTTLDAKRRRSYTSFVESEDDEESPRTGSHVSTSSSGILKEAFFDTTEQLKKSRQHAAALNKLLEEITWNLQARGLPVMICVGSFSLFAPHRISEAHIQILHVTLDQIFQEAISPDLPSDSDPEYPRIHEQLSFIDPFALASLDKRPPRPKLERHQTSSTTSLTSMTTLMKSTGVQSYHQTVQTRDHSIPSPLWPNAIPTRKRQIMNANAERYGVDPYFRAWMRANVNARTRSNTYAKYMIEQEDDPFVNKRLEFTESTTRATLILDVLVNGTQALKEQISSTVNRERYEHNRRLECRRIIEHGSRLRMVRFGFTQPIYPPHTPEMDSLGLTKELYHTILSRIDAIHTNAQLRSRSAKSSPKSYLMASLNKIMRRSAEDALMEVSEYIRELNASQRRVVWTIERIPRVYDRGLGRDRTEWEISAWNGDDPLELVIQLERWGIIEKRLDVEEED